MSERYHVPLGSDVELAAYIDQETDAAAFATGASSVPSATLTPGTPDENVVKTQAIPAGTWTISVSVTWKVTTPPVTMSETTFFWDAATGLVTSEWVGVVVGAAPATAIVLGKAVFAVETTLSLLCDYEGTAQDIDIQFGKIVWVGAAA